MRFSSVEKSTFGSTGENRGTVPSRDERGPVRHWTGPAPRALMLYDVASITVRVVPRSSRAIVERWPRGIVVRVRAPAEAGRATEEARRVLAAALGTPRSRVTLRTGS